MNASLPWMSIATCGFLFWLGTYLGRFGLRGSQVQLAPADRKGQASQGTAGARQKSNPPVTQTRDPYQEAVSKLADQKDALERGIACFDSPDFVDEKSLQASLLPAMELNEELAKALQQLRERPPSDSVRTDPVTGLGNEFTMAEWLRMMFGLMIRYGRIFSLAIIEVDVPPNEEPAGLTPTCDASLCAVTNVITSSMRETDVVFGLPNHQLAVALPETDLDGTQIFAQRVQHDIETALQMSVSVGVSAARDDDSAHTLMERVQAAVFAAKSGGANRVFRHTGYRIEAVEPASTNSTVCAL